MTQKKGEESTNWLTNQDTWRMVYLFGGGIFGLLYLIVKKNRNIFSWIGPVGMIVAGIDLFLKYREKRIKKTGDQIMSQLDELDPIARAEVVKYLAEQKKDK